MAALRPRIRAGANLRFASVTDGRNPVRHTRLFHYPLRLVLGGWRAVSRRESSERRSR